MWWVVNTVSTRTLAAVSFFICSSLIFLSMASTQTGSSPHPTILLKLPEGMDAVKPVIYYFMTGAFGGYGGDIGGKPSARTYTIDAAVGDSPATDVKVIAWLPGCEMPAFDIPVQEQKIERMLDCKPLGTVRLKGQFTPGSLLVPRDTLGEITVDYLAGWSHGFFGIADGMVPQFRVGAAAFNDDGSFEISLPDLASQRGMDDGWFTFILRERGTGNIVAFMPPEENGSLTHNLKVLHEYAPLVHFAAEDPHPTVTKLISARRP